MANEQRGEAPLQVGGKTYTLHYGWNAIAQIETISGFTIGEVGKMITPKNFHGGILRIVLWGTLRKHHSELDLDAVGDLMDEIEDPTSITEAVGLAMTRSSVGGRGKSENPQKASQ